MGRFLGPYADLTDYALGNFLIEGFVARDSSGAPLWRVVCGNCRHHQTLSHTKLAPLVQGRRTQATLLCANTACPLSRYQRQIETIDDLRRRERTEAEEAARAAEAKRRADSEAATKQQANNARLAALKASYRTYWLHQIKTSIEESKIAPFAIWCTLSDGTHKTILDILRADPDVRIQGL